jgi:hypothetical protein
VIRHLLEHPQVSDRELYRDFEDRIPNEQLRAFLADLVEMGAVLLENDDEYFTSTNR